MPPEAVPDSRIAVFGDFRLDLCSGDLWKFDLRLRLQDQPLRILKLLLARPGQLVSREDLRRNLWSDDTFVDFENGLNAAINRLREALVDNAKKPRFIETSPRRGYRFIAEVRFLSSPESTAAVPADGTPVPAPPLTADRWRRWVLGGAAVAFLLLAGFTVARWRGFRFWARAPRSIHSLAVLPLRNLSGDPAEDYFADGMTDELTTDLAEISTVRVVSSTSAMQFKNSTASLTQIARALDVDAVVEGSVIRDGDRVRINAQLIYAPSDSHLWAGSFERDGSDVLALEDDVARAIVVQIRPQITSRERSLLSRSTRVNPAAFSAFLQSRFLLENQRTVEGAKQSTVYAQRALSLDSNFALGYAGLAESYASLSYLGGGPPSHFLPRAETAARKAIELDPTLAAAHTALGSILLTYEYDWPAADGELARAIDLEPNDSDAHRWHANYLLATGKLDPALAEMRLAEKLDPLSMWTARDVGRVLYFSHHYHEAISQLQKARALSPDHRVVDNWIGWSYYQLGLDQKALADLLTDSAENGTPPSQMTSIQRAASSAGLRGYARAVLHRRARAAEYNDPYIAAQLHLMLGDRSVALGLLEDAYQQRSAWITWIAVDPAWDPVRTDPRFRRLLGRMKLLR